MRTINRSLAAAVLLFSVVIFNSCDKKMSTNNTPTTLEGTWRLVAIYMDPGDGSGDFEPVNSYKTLTFSSEGSLSSNGEICQISSAVGKPTTGTYSQSKSTISASCGSQAAPWDIKYEMKGTELLLHYTCIEACIAKFEKIH